jgi:hypothetical protein
LIDIYTLITVSKTIERILVASPKIVLDLQYSTSRLNALFTKLTLLSEILGTFWCDVLNLIVPSVLLEIVARFLVFSFTLSKYLGSYSIDYILH